MDCDGHDAVVATPTGQNDREKKKGVSSPFERRSLIDRVKLTFSHGLTSHGALTEKVVLYGTSGQGKRHVAAQVAKEITQIDGRRVLRINGLTFDTFVRDYCLLYHDLTGQYLPCGLGLAVTLAKIKHMLEERRQEWLMVITDLGLFSDREAELASSLPDRGHILVTSDALAFPPTAKDPKVIDFNHIASALKFADNADEALVKGLSDAERRQFALHFCPDLLNISPKESGNVQRWDYATVPLYLRITAINLQLLKMDFAHYRRSFKKQLDHSKLGRYDGLGEYSLAFHVATKITWDEIGNYDTWAQRLLLVLAVVANHSVPLKLVRKVSIFSKTITDTFSPALDFLTSLGLVTISYESTEPEISIMHHDVSRWLGKHARIRLRDEMRRVVVSWVSLLSEELVTSEAKAPSYWGPTLVSQAYDIRRSWSYFPLIQALTSTISSIGVFDTYRHPFSAAQRQRTAVLNFLLNAAETFTLDRRVTYHARGFADEAFKILAVMRYLFCFGDYQSYLLRIKHVQIRAHMATKHYLRAEQELRAAKRCLRLLAHSISDPLSNMTGTGQQGYQSTTAPSLPDNAASTAISPPFAGPFQPNHNSTSAVPDVTSNPALLTVTSRTHDLEAQLLLLQQRYSQAFLHVASVLRPEPDETSLADPYVLAQRYNWCATALIGQRAHQNSGAEALLWSHAAMRIWAMFDEDTRWGKGDRMGVEILAWVEQHALLLIEMRKFKGALLFLPRLLDVWQELIPMGDGKLWRLARNLVECYVKLDMTREAEEVVERMLEILNASSNGMTDLSGLGGARDGGGYDDERVGDGEGRETFWWMLIDMARGYLKVGSVIVAEGIARFCLGSWRRRHVGEWEELEVIEEPGASATPLAKSKAAEDVHDRNHNSRQRWKERESTWKKSVPMGWWAFLVEVLVMQGKVEEPKQLVEELTMDLDETESQHEQHAFLRRVEAYRLMRKVYQRGIWAEEDGCLREWKLLLGESRDRFLLRRAAKAFGSVVRRVREERDFASDIDLNLESHAKRHSKILHLLDRNWGHKDGFSPRLRWEMNEYVEDVITHPTCNQDYLCKMWLWCQCRKKRRSRAWSIDPLELIRKRFIREDDKREQRTKPWKQTTLDKWLYLLVPPVYRPAGCHDECPCIDANIAGIAQEAVLEAKLWTYTEPVNPHRIPMATRARYKSAKDKQDASQLPGFDFDVDRLSRESNDEDGCTSWLWYPPEHSPADYGGENYIRPWALDLPNIAITFVENEDDGEEETVEVRGKDDDTRKYLRLPIDMRLLPEPSVRLSAGNRLTMEKPGRQKQKKKLERLARAYSDRPSIIQREHIKPYLTMDEKTEARYAEKAKHAHDIVIIDEYYMPVETISESAAEVEAAGGPVNGTADGAEASHQVEDMTEAGNHNDAHESGIESHLDNDGNESEAAIVGATETELEDQVGGG